MTVQTRGAELLGRTLGGRYRLLALIGTGASAGVYLAEDTSLRRRVAVKVLHPGLAHDAAFQKRFRAEARAAAALSHPHVLAVHDWGEADGAYLVTELLEGGSLRDLLASGARLSLSQALLVGLHAAQGLAYAHRHGLVHRDIKPGNLLFDRDGRLRIADFGIARAVAEAAWTEPEGVLVGTARYAAPEQARGGTIDGRADVYALALTVVEAVTGEVPLVADTPLGTMGLRQSQPIPVPDALGPLAEPLRRAGAVDPEERPTAEGLVAALLAAATRLERPAPLPLPGLPTTAPGPAADRTAVLPGQVAPPAGGTDPTTAVPLVPPAEPGGAPDPAPDPAPVEGAEHGPGPAAPPAGAGSATGAGPAPEAAGTSAPTGAAGTMAVPGAAGTPPHPATGSGAPAGADRAAAGSAAPLPGTPAGTGDDDEVEPAAGRRRWPWLVLALLIVVAAAGAGTWQYLRTRTPTYEVGAYVGTDVEEVRRLAAGNGWVLVEAVERRDGTVAGEVLEQDPAAGATLAEGSALAVLVSEGQLLRTVPALAGVAVEDAEAALAAADLALGTVTAEHHEEVPEGQVVSASSPEGAQLETGTAVDLVVSAGPAPRTVPDVAGGPPADAVAALEALGLVPEVVEQHHPQVPEGSIIAVEPGAGQQVERGSTVRVLVSLGRPFVTVPNVVGLSAAEASERLEAAGFVVVDTVGPPNRPVLVTDPPAGERRRQGEPITIVTRSS